MGTRQNTGLDDKGFKYFAGDSVGESTSAPEKSTNTKGFAHTVIDRP